MDWGGLNGLGRGHFFLGGGGGDMIMLHIKLKLMMHAATW